MRVLLFSLIAMSIATGAMAQALAPDICLPTPRLRTANYPGPRAIPSMNDLTQYSGKAVAASGQKLVIQGQLRDKACVPVKDAIIEIWQVDPYGNWRLATRSDQATPGPVFNGAGRTYTDNNGNFLFTTLFPAALPKRAPLIYVRITAPNMTDFGTRLYFENDERNINDADYKRLSLESRQRVELRMQPLAGANAGFSGTIELVLPEKARYRSY